MQLWAMERQKFLVSLLNFSKPPERPPSVKPSRVESIILKKSEKIATVKFIQA